MAQRSGKATLALSLGLIGLLTSVIGVGLLFAVGAIVLGHQAAKEIDASNGQIGGRGRAAGAVGLGRFSAVGACLAIVVAVLFVARSAVNRKRNENQLTSVAQSLILWSDQFYQQTQDYPRTGLVPPPPGYTIVSNSPMDRLGALCNMGSDALYPSLLINPQGTDVAAQGSPHSITLLPNNVSYALLDGENIEWKNGINAAAPILADKQVGKGSFWNKKHWEGHVLWGDTHVTYENPGPAGKDWPTTTINGTTNVYDNLFTGTTGPTATDAVLINP